MTTKFKGGQIVITRSIADTLNTMQIKEILDRHFAGDWGDLGDEDKQTNEYAVQHGDRILSKYTIDGEGIYIITEWDRSVTTILYTDEY